MAQTNVVTVLHVICPERKRVILVDRLKTALALFGISVAAIIGVEVLARGVLTVRDSLFSERTETVARVELKRWENSPAYEGAEFDPVILFREINEVIQQQGYSPYLEWGNSRFDGTLLNADEEGFRITTDNSNSEDALEIWFLGGSTVYGIGAEDSETIPSHLTRQLNDVGIDARVRNFGQLSFVSTQEVVLLIRELQKGNRPHIVIFYDGANDAIGAGAWPDVPGAHIYLGRYEDLLNSSEEEEDSDIVSVLRSTASQRILLGIAARMFSDEKKEAPTESTEPERSVAELAQQATDITYANYRIVSSLANEFLFEPVFIFQPALGVGEKPLHPAEKDILSAALTYPGRFKPWWPGIPIHQEMRNLVRQSSDAEYSFIVHDLSDVFEETEEPIYLDWVHTSGYGNGLIADSIFEIVAEQICKSNGLRAFTEDPEEYCR